MSDVEESLSEGSWEVRELEARLVLCRRLPQPSYDGDNEMVDARRSDAVCLTSSFKTGESGCGREEAWLVNGMGGGGTRLVFLWDTKEP